METPVNNNKLLELLKELSKGNVKFVVCGGVACFLQGVERVTYDLDISASLDSENLKNLIEVTKKYDLIPRVPEPAENLLDENKRNDWINKKGALVFTFTSNKNLVQLDIFLKYPKSYEELLRNADVMDIDGIKVCVSSKDDLIFAKEYIVPLRDKDNFDIQQLKKMKNDRK